MSDNFKALAEKIKAKIRDDGGRSSFKDLADWAKETEIGSTFVLYIIVKDMIERGELAAIGGYEEDPELVLWKAPKFVALNQGVQTIGVKEAAEAGKHEKAALGGEQKGFSEEVKEARVSIDMRNLDEPTKRALNYLSEYWSVGEIRFRLDLKRLGVNDPDKVLHKLLDMGVIDLTPSGVVNLKIELPKAKKPPSLAELV